MADTKLIGDITEMKFAVACMERGLTVSKPIGDNARYDFIVENAGVLFKVQVKTSNFSKTRSAYTVSASRRVPYNTKQGSKIVRYQEGEIDVLVSEILGDWIILDNPHKLPASIALYYPFRTSKYLSNINKWEILNVFE